MPLIISSQRFVNPDIVEAKRSEDDYTVYYMPIQTDYAEQLWVIVDGHHSLAAAKEDDVIPDYQLTPLFDDYKQEIEQSGTDTWLLNHYGDSNYYDIETGLDIDSSVLEVSDLPTKETTKLIVNRPSTIIRLKRAKDRAMQEGPKGGRYYITEGGTKKYISS